MSKYSKYYAILVSWCIILVIKLYFKNKYIYTYIVIYGCLFTMIFNLISLYSLIWDFLLSQINIWTTTTWSNVWVVLPKPSWYEFLIGFLIWTPTSKYLHLTTFSNICVWFYPCSYICDCLKMPKKSQINEYSDHYWRYEYLYGVVDLPHTSLISRPLWLSHVWD